MLTKIETCFRLNIKENISCVHLLLLTGLSLVLWLQHVQKLWWIGIIYLIGSLVARRVASYTAFTIPLFIVFVFEFSLGLLGHIPAISRLPMVDLVIVILVSWLVLKKLRPETKLGEWRLRFTKPEIISLLIILVPTLFALITYYMLNRDVAAQGPLPPMAWYYSTLIIVCIALFNGLREEFAYRFVLQQALMVGMPVSVAIFVQAIAFGFLHYLGGFPSGTVGVLLTWFFGAAIGVQYYYFRNPVLTWVTHSMADFVMFIIILVCR